LNTLYGATPALGQELASELKGKIVLDTGNPDPQRDGAIGGGRAPLES
jgi:8-hydroxy-5-deazaflavin:NADPH oxidoreductase